MKNPFLTVSIAGIGGALMMASALSDPEIHTIIGPELTFAIGAFLFVGFVLCSIVVFSRRLQSKH